MRNEVVYAIILLFQAYEQLPLKAVAAFYAHIDFKGRNHTLAYSLGNEESGSCGQVILKTKEDELMKEQILDILGSIRADVDYASETALVDEGFLDSMDIVAVVGAFTDAFDVEIGVIDLIPENFNSVQAMEALVTRLSQ